MGYGHVLVVSSYSLQTDKTFAAIMFSAICGFIYMEHSCPAKNYWRVYLAQLMGEFLR